MAHLHIFPDTNLLMHFVRPDQTDWRTITGASTVTLTFAPAVLAELDKHKNQHPVRRLKHRARDVSAWFRKLNDGDEVAAGVTVEFLSVEPAAPLFADGLDPHVSDDRLIASVLELALSGRAVAVATDDTLLSRKVRARGIQWIEPPPEGRLRDQPDPLEAENAQLRRENRELINRQPKLLLAWTDEERKERTLTVNQAAGERPPKPDQIRFLHAPLPSREGPAPENPWARISLGMLSDEQIVAYNTELLEFYDLYDIYYEAELAWRDRARRMLELRFTLENQGTVSANDIRIAISLPKQRLRLVDPKKEPDRPERPQPPDKPNAPRLGLAVELARIGGSVGFGARGSPSLIPDIAALYSGDDDRPRLDLAGNTAKFRIPKLQHGYVREFRPVYCIADPALVGSGASITIGITADELPSAVKAKLVLKLSDGVA